MLAALPIPAGPAHHETLASYVNRLAALHTMPVRELWDQLSIPRPGGTGRIVLIEHVEAHVVYTVKVHGEEWTLKSLGPVFGAQEPSKPWDVVNVVVDPQVVELSIAAPCVMRLT